MNRRDERFLAFIIPAYNIAGWLETCLRSIEAQTVPMGWKCVVVDDGSTDETNDELDGWVRRDERFRGIHQPNLGVNLARKRGLLSVGEPYIWFVDGDDALHPETVRIVSPYLANDDVDLWVVDEIVAEKVTFSSFRDVPGYRIYSRTEFSKLPPFVMHRAIFRRKYAGLVKFDSLKVGEDILFVLRQMLLAQKIGWLHAPLYGYQQRSDSVMHTRSPSRVLHAIEFLRRLLLLQSENRALLSPRGFRQRQTDMLFKMPYEMTLLSEGSTGEIEDSWFATLADLGTIEWCFRYRVCRALILPCSRSPFARRMVVRMTAFIFKKYASLVQYVGTLGMIRKRKRGDRVT